MIQQEFHFALGDFASHGNPAAAVIGNAPL